MKSILHTKSGEDRWRFVVESAAAGYKAEAGIKAEAPEENR